MGCVVCKALTVDSKCMRNGVPEEECPGIVESIPGTAGLINKATPRRSLPPTHLLKRAAAAADARARGKPANARQTGGKVE